MGVFLTLCVSVCVILCVYLKLLYCFSSQLKPINFTCSAGANTHMHVHVHMDECVHTRRCTFGRTEAAYLSMVVKVRSQHLGFYTEFVNTEKKWQNNMLLGYKVARNLRVTIFEQFAGRHFCFMRGCTAKRDMTRKITNIIYPP